MVVGGVVWTAALKVAAEPGDPVPTDPAVGVFVAVLFLSWSSGRTVEELVRVVFPPDAAAVPTTSKSRSAWLSIWDRQDRRALGAMLVAAGGFAYTSKLAASVKTEL